MLIIPHTLLGTKRGDVLEAKDSYLSGTYQVEIVQCISVMKLDPPTLS